MTLDDQLAALAPLTPGQVAFLAGYRSRASQMTAYRARGSTIPADRLREVARRLRAMADAADALTGMRTVPPRGWGG